MKAIAKHNCQVTLTTSLNTLSFDRMSVLKGQEIDLPIFEDRTLPEGKIADTLGKRCVIFQDGIILMPTYSRDFDYTI